MEKPVYLITGFLESGKTSMIKETLLDPDFTENERTLILSFEEGIEDYDPVFLKKAHAFVIHLEKEEITPERLEKLDQESSFERVMIEFNGMWSVDEFLDLSLPEDWILVQILSLVDASTFGLFMNNMRSLIYQQIQHSEVVIFNRCDETTRLSFLRSNIKAVNPRCQLVYENRDGSTSELKEEDLPFDFSQDIMTIEDGDYGLWYMDALEHPRKYAGRKLRLKGMVIEKVQGAKHSILFGRYAMVCCAEDTSLLGVIISGVKTEQMSPHQWIQVVGEAVLQRDDQNQEILVIKAVSLAHAVPLQDELVYFS